MEAWYLVITLCSGLNCTITTGPYDTYDECIAYRERAVASDTENVGIFKCRNWYAGMQYERQRYE